jgi:hypothetical protein
LLIITRRLFCNNFSENTTIKSIKKNNKANNTGLLFT